MPRQVQMLPTGRWALDVLWMVFILGTAGMFCCGLSLPVEGMSVVNPIVRNESQSIQLKILYMESHPGHSVSYYSETVRSLQRLFEVKYLHSSSKNSSTQEAAIRDIIRKNGSPFHIVMLGWGYLTAPPDQWLPCKFLRSLHLPLAIVLNKEYARLDAKLEYIRSCKPVVAFSAHHEVQQYTEQTGIPFNRVPFAAAPQNFNFLVGSSERTFRYDFGFTGLVRAEQTENWRTQILQDIDSFKNLGLRVFTHAGNSFRPLSLHQYKEIMKHTKIWLSTTGPVNLVGTRYFEVLMSGTTMLICNRIAKVYDGLFEEDRHVVMFSSLEELRRKVKYYIDNEQERQKIVRQAHTLALANHSFDNRARELGCILKDSIDYRSRPKSQTLKGPIPWELVSQQDEFTMNGNFPLRSRALRRQDQPGSWSNGQLPRGFKPVVNGLIVRWPVKAVEALVQAVFSGIDISPPDYPKAALLICRALEQVKGIGSKALVLGSISPWVEAILLSKNYTVLTADYNLPECAFPGINFIPMASLALYVRSFDLVVSYSSIEHDGLGRYGDPIDPSGDFYAMKEIKSLLAPGGMLFLGVPVSENVGGLHFNRHRIYNKVRLSELVSEFEYMGIVWNSENIQLTRKHFTHMDIWRSQKSNNQPLLLLKKSETC